MSRHYALHDARTNDVYDLDLLLQEWRQKKDDPDFVEWAYSLEPLYIAEGSKVPRDAYGCCVWDGFRIL